MAHTFKGLNLPTPITDDTWTSATEERAAACYGAAKSCDKKCVNCLFSAMNEDKFKLYLLEEFKRQMGID